MKLTVDIRKKWNNFHLDISFQTEDAVTGLLGASGCGKSMTLKCIAGIETPDAGRIVLDDRVLFDSEKGINLPPQQRQVGYLFQNYALFPHMTVKKNLQCGMKDKRDGEKLGEMVVQLGLEGLEERLPHQLSGGQAQRVALGRMLLSQPQLLLLDEPFSALDSYLRDEMQLQLRELLLRVERQTLLVTHSRTEAYHLCTCLCVIEGGKVTQLGEKKDVFLRPQTVGAARMMGYRNIVPAEKLGEKLVYLPTWGVQLVTAEKVPVDMAAVAIAQSAFVENGGENRLDVTKIQEMDAPNHPIVLFYCSTMQCDCPPIWWRIAQEHAPQVERLWVPSDSILMLRESEGG